MIPVGSWVVGMAVLGDRVSLILSLLLFGLIFLRNRKRRPLKMRREKLPEKNLIIRKVALQAAVPNLRRRIANQGLLENRR